MNKSTDKVDLIKQEIVGLEKVKQEQFGLCKVDWAAAGHGQGGTDDGQLGQGSRPAVTCLRRMPSGDQHMCLFHGPFGWRTVNSYPAN